MTTRLDDAVSAVYDSRVPEAWMLTPSGAELSWLSPSLSMWYTGLIERHTQFAQWLSQSRPNTYWLTGFFNPQGFLTALRQEVTRLHAPDRWSLDDVVFHTEVTEHANSETVKKPAVEGALIHGLFIDGCKWSRGQKSLSESEPKKLFSTLPVLFVTAVTSHQRKSKTGDLGPFGGYEAPCYKYPSRRDCFKVFDVLLPTREIRPQHWVLRGVALLCSTS